MSISAIGSSSQLTSALQTAGLSSSKVSLVENDLDASIQSSTSSSGTTADDATVRATLDKKIADDVKSGKLTQADATAISKVLDQAESSGSTSSSSTGSTQSAGAAPPAGGGGGGGGGAGGSSTKTEVSRSVTVSGAVQTITITYSDGTSETTTSAATSAELAKEAEKKSDSGSASAQDSTKAATATSSASATASSASDASTSASDATAKSYLAQIEPGTLVDKLA